MISRRVIYPAAESINLWGKVGRAGLEQPDVCFFPFFFLFLDMISTGLTTLYDSPVLAGPWVYIEDKTNSQKLRYASTRSQQSYSCWPSRVGDLWTARGVEKNIRRGERKHGFHLWLSSDDGHFIVAQLHPIDRPSLIYIYFLLVLLLAGWPALFCIFPFWSREHSSVHSPLLPISLFLSLGLYTPI